jgi:hypothetical protein
MSRLRKTVPLALLIATGMIAMTAANASAAPRFAAPGGDGVEPCNDPDDPCSIFTAADRAGGVSRGDEVVLAPGEYSSSDLGPAGSVILEPGISVHGAFGQPRPVIRLTAPIPTGALVVGTDDVVSHLEIETAVARSAIIIRDGTVEDLIARSSASIFGTIVCNHTGGTIRSSVCLSSGDQATAIGSSFSGDGTFTARLRNVTAVATGTNSRGLDYLVAGNVNFTLLAKAVVADGEGSDVAAAGLSFSGFGASVRIELDHSDYATVSTRTDAGGGAATVTPPGTATNITDPPFLAADGFHQLRGSPTVDKGAIDAQSGGTDIDGEARVLGAAADIGADELDHSTTTLSCTPERVALGDGSRCTARVAGEATRPSGSVEFAKDGQGTFSDDASCDLEPAGALVASCQVTYTATAAGDHAHEITVTFPGDERHEGSEDTATVGIGDIRFAAPGGTGVDPCINRAEPCSIFTAAAADAPDTTVQEGDEVILAPGEYSDAAGDLGPDGAVRAMAGIKVHGAAGMPRPVIQLTRDTTVGAFFVGANVSVSHVEIDSAAARTNISVSGGSVSDLIARSSAAGPVIVCTQTDGAIRDSACLSNGDDAIALGTRTSLGGTQTVQLRNVTALATGAGSFGLAYLLADTVTVDVSGKGVIARGAVEDVFVAVGPPPNEPGTGADVQIVLDHSAYVNTGVFADAGGGSASVTPPGSPTNIVGRPLLAADGYHQLPGSPTLDAGAVDRFSGTTDIDGQLRTIGVAPDIGADEAGHFTTTSVACTPLTATLGDAPGTCTATVANVAGGPAPTGSVVFGTAAPGALGSADCALVAAGPREAICSVTYAPGALGTGTHVIDAEYFAGESHEPSQGSTTVSVKPPAAPPSDKGSPPGNPPPSTGPRSPVARVSPPTRLKKNPRPRTAARVAVFTFSSDQAGSSFECKLDGRPFRDCDSLFRAKVKPGAHIFRVRAIGAGGAVDSTPVVFRWTVVGASRARR